MSAIEQWHEVMKDGERLIVPHPRMHERSFVISPLQELSDKRTHPILGQNISVLIQKLPVNQEAKILEGVSL